MKVTLIVDGKVNPIGINRERVRLSVKTNKAPCFDKVEYFIYRTKEDAKNNLPMLYYKGEQINAYFGGENFADLTEY